MNLSLHFGIDLYALSAFEMELEEQGCLVTHVRGQYCETWDELHQEFSAAFQFPWFYGNNIPAFVECLTEVGARDSEACGLVLSIWNSGRLLNRESDRSKSLALFEEILGDVAGELKQPTGITVGQIEVSRSLTVLLHDENSAPKIMDQSIAAAILALSR